MEPRSRLKSILGNAALFLGATLVMLLVAEFSVRLLMGDQINMLPRYHTDAHYGEFTLRKLRPNSDFWHKTIDGSWRFVTNNRGFRSYHDYEYEKPVGQIRVLSLGDSHTQGYEVRQDHTFSAIVERYLQREGSDTEVLNTGISGFSTAEELIFLENEGIKYSEENPYLVDIDIIDNDGLVIASSGGGPAPTVRELVSDRTDGYVVAQDPSAVADRIIEILGDPERAARMGERGREKVLPRYTWERIGERVTGCYEYLMGGV